MRRNILVVGQSHTAAIRDAAKIRREDDPDAPRTRVIHLGEARYAPEVGERDGAPRFSAPLETEIAHQLGHQALVASCISANTHNVLGLMRHRRPFDFLLSSGPSDQQTLDHLAETIPEILVRQTLQRMMAQDLLRLRLLHDLARPLVHLQSPPPLADDARIAAEADAFFKERGITVEAVAPRGLRYRLWQLHSAIMAEACTALGIVFLPVPVEALDDDGFLNQAFAGDATHGNAAYGEAWIRTLEAL